MDQSMYQDSFAEFCNHLPPNNPTILDVACGPGNITKCLLALRPDLQITGIDLAPNMLALAAENNPTATFRLMDCRYIANLPGPYSGVMCGFCLPYLTREEAVQFIADAATILTPGGVLYLSTMEDNHTASGWQKSSTGDDMYINYHEAIYLIEALSRNNFTLLREQRITYSTAPGKLVIDLILIASLNGR